MKIGIVGAGLAGLTAAAAFARNGAQVVIYERPGSLPAGAGISLFGNGLRALDAIGLGEAVRALGQTASTLPAGLRRPDGRWLIRTPPAASAELRVVHRRDLHAVLAAAAPTVRLSTVQQVRTTPTSATVMLESGDSADFDLVVAADGIGSGVRGALFDDPGIRYAGYTAWRGVAEEVAVDAAGETWGRGERFGITPIDDRRVYWFAVASVPAHWSVADEGAEVRRRFGSWHAPIRTLLDATDGAAILRNDILDLARPLSTFVRGRVVLIGDAAHAMTPNLGQGGNQALEDAVTLALLTGRCDMQTALDRYDAVRRARTTPIAKRSRQLGRIAQARGPVAVALRNGLMRITPAGSATRAAARVQAWEPPVQPGTDAPDGPRTRSR